MPVDLPSLATADDLDAAAAALWAAVAELRSTPTGYDDTGILERLTALENRPPPVPYNDTELVTRLTALENQPPPVPYDDTAVIARLTELEAEADEYSWDMCGMLPFNTCPGTTLAEKWKWALDTIEAAPYKPTLVFANGVYDLRGIPARACPTGFRWTGPLGARGREFRTTCKVILPAGGLFKISTTKDHQITGLSFEGGLLFAPIPVDGSKGAWTDLDVTKCGFQGLTRVMEGAMLRANFQEHYINGATQTPLKLGGSDCELYTAGTTYVSGKIPATQAYIDTGALANSKIGKAYVTPQVGYALRVANGRNALNFYGFVSDCTGRSPVDSTQGAAIRVEGGEGVAFFGGKVFNANAGNLDPGDVMFTGGHDHIVMGMHFQRQVDPAGTGYVAPNVTRAAIYTTVPLWVISPVAVYGRPKVLQQAAAGLIRCNDPSWQIITQAA